MRFVDFIIFYYILLYFIIFAQLTHVVRLLDKYNKKKLSLDIISVSHFY